jgi:hypothetical protein
MLETINMALFAYQKDNETTVQGVKGKGRGVPKVIEVSSQFVLKMIDFAQRYYDTRKPSGNIEINCQLANVANLHQMQPVVTQVVYKKKKQLSGLPYFGMIEETQNGLLMKMIVFPKGFVDML